MRGNPIFGQFLSSFVSLSTALEPLSWVSRTIAAIVVHSSSEDQLDSDILLPETNEYEAYYSFVSGNKMSESSYGSNAVERDTKDDSSVTNRQQAGSNDTQSTNATPTVDEQDTNDTPMAFINHRCVIGTWFINRRCVIATWLISGRCVIRTWLISGRCVIDTWFISGRCVMGYNL
jgi:hypothetical protein